MKNSHFVNPHGLSTEGHYSTAHDLALLGRALIRDFPVA
jgi:D-alanyl-D-alanine carboxypeptidase (penicillin-binding protein 5/6)